MLLRAILPDVLIDNFEVVNFEKTDSRFDIYLDEKKVMMREDKNAKIKELKTRIATLEKQLGKKKAKEDADDEPKKHRGKGKPKEKVEKLIASNTVL